MLDTISIYDSDEKIKEYLSSESGRYKILNAISNTVRRRLDAGSILRRVFIVDPLPPGTVPSYESDDVGEYPTLYIDKNKDIQLKFGEPYVQLDEFQIGDVFKINWENGSESKVLQVFTTNVNKYIVEQEYKLFKKLMFSASQYTNMVVDVNSVNYDDIIDLAFKTYSFSTESVVIIGQNNIDEFTYKPRVKESTNHYGLNIIMCAFDMDEIYITTAPENLGVMAIRTDITLLGDLFGKIDAYCELGVGIVCPQNVTRICVRR